MNARPVPGIASPCVRNCCLDDDEVCLGCGRAIGEIIGWSQAADAEREAILARARQRLELKAGRADWNTSRKGLKP